ncbi:MAG: glycine cleavage system protein GcvH [Candidatus Hydrogenedentes bacterium]|nr:glycine cleavage system protein GcvH [Candidatus Hydrogenedentota bacterium]
MNPQHLKYSQNHEWIRDDGVVFVVGITDYAVEQLGDITYIELPEVGLDVAQDDDVASIESVKAASEVYAPVGGRVAQINQRLLDQPEIVNKSPYEDGWFFKLEDIERAEFDALMSASEYESYLKEQ